MADYLDTLKRTLGQLTEQRRHIDADIQDLQRIITRHEGGDTPTPRTQRQEGRAAPPGVAREETLSLMQDGEPWTVAKLAAARGVTSNAARNMLQRLAKEDPPKVTYVSGIGYRIASYDGAQGSLPVTAGREDDAAREGVDDVVSRAPA